MNEIVVWIVSGRTCFAAGTFLGSPLKDFLALRQEVFRTLNDGARFVPGSPTPALGIEAGMFHASDRAGAFKAFRDAGHDLIAFAESNPLLTHSLKLVRIEIVRAGERMLDLSDARRGHGRPGAEEVKSQLRLFGREVTRNPGESW
jgi:hypothetical protein